MEKNNKYGQKMYYRILGGTGLQVSVLSFGFWATYGVKDGLTNEEGITMAKECMSLARQKGINLFDNAETYGNPAGATEEIMGEAMAGLDGFLAIEKYLLKKREIFA
jgi:aryl-alcohol dehydrogenase-like predicted oxidoreductase